jgi:hypothetical protein
MIIGVNDESQIANQSFLDSPDILDAIIKKNCNKVRKHTIDSICESQIKRAQLMCIFGSSIGATDNLWWQLIIDQLLNGDCRLIIFHKTENTPSNQQYKYGRAGRAFRESFLKRTLLTAEEEKIVDQKIYIGINTNMFQL